nr:site-specific integrase [Nakamurella aerolata]
MLTRLYTDLLKAGGAKGRPLARSTVEKVHAILRKAFHDAVNIDQLLNASPVDRAKRPRKQSAAAKHIWTPADLRVFLETTRPHRLFPFFHLAAYTGARRGELLNLRWSNVDLDAGSLEIQGTVAVINGQRVEGTTKGGHARTVSLDDATVAVLRSHQRDQRDQRFAAGPDWAAGDFVFTRGAGLPLYPDTPSQLIPKLIEQHNKTANPSLPRIRLHDLRHIHATVLLEAGVPVHVVAGRLGHADPAITLRVYAHVLRASETKAADIFASAVGG